MTIAKLLKVLDVFEDEAAALTSFKKPAVGIETRVPVLVKESHRVMPPAMPIHWLTHLFGCWHKEMNQPFTLNHDTYCTCMRCGARRHFNVERSKMTGSYYYAPPSVLYDPPAPKKAGAPVRS